MQTQRTRLLTVLLAALFCLPGLGMAQRQDEPPMQAASGAAGIAAQINSFTAGGGTTGSLAAVAEGDTVSVTGQMHYPGGDAATLELDIDAGVTVQWQAEYVSGQNTNGQGLLVLRGEGSFELAEGGLLHNAVINGSSVIFIDGPGFTLKVTGGTILSAARGNYAVDAPSSNVSIQVAGGRIESQNYGGIFVYHAASSFSMTGGEIIASDISSAPAVYSAGSTFVGGGSITGGSTSLLAMNPTEQTRMEGGSIHAGATGSPAVTVSAGGFAMTGGLIAGGASSSAVFAVDRASILLAGDAKVSGSGVAVIQMQSGTLTMRDTAQVVAGQGYGIAAQNMNPTQVIDIHMQNNAAIHAHSSAVVIDSGAAAATFTQSGGSIYTEGGYALSVSGTGPIQIESQRGQMLAANERAVYVQNETGEIRLYGGVVASLGGGVAAIEATGASVAIEANSGLVLGHVTHTDAVIKNASGCRLVGDGLLAAWAEDSTNAYIQYESRDISLVSERGRPLAQWDINEAGLGGIRFALDDNRGFLPLPPVRVAEYIPVQGISGPPDSITAGQATPLAATVLPTEASFRTVVWSVESNTIGAVVENGVLTAGQAGSITLTATIENGSLPTGPYTQRFTIQVLAPAPTDSSGPSPSGASGAGSGTSDASEQGSDPARGTDGAGVHTGDAGMLPLAVLCALLATAALVALGRARRRG